MVVSFFGASALMAGFVIVATRLGVDVPIDTTLGGLVLRLAMYVVMTALFVALPYYVWRMPFSRREVGLARELTWADIGLAIAGFVLYGLLSMVALALARQVPGFNTAQVQDLGLQNILGMERMIAFITLVIVTPFIEEFIFRGVLYGKLRVASMSIAAAGFVVSILFAIAHGQWNVGIDVFCLSLVAIALREVTGTIWAGVLMHMIKNAIAFYLLFVAAQGF